MKLTLAITLLLTIFALPKSFAQTTLSVPIGEKLLIPIKVETASPCNLEIAIAGKIEQRVIEPSGANFSIEFETTEIGNHEIKWEGRFRSRGLKSVPACSSSGLVKITATANTEKRKDEWSKLFGSLSVDQSECVKVGLRQRGILFESIDPLAKLESPSSATSRDVFSKCDSFTARKTIWGTNNKEDFPCTLRGGEKSRCRGVYAEKMPDGKLRSISLDDALKLHIDGRPWTTGQIELQSGKTEREQQARVEQERREKEDLAKKEAEDRERKWKESPEYKRQQAEMEKRRLAEERQATALKAKEEQERELKAQKERAAIDAQRAQEEKSRQKKQTSGISGTFKCVNKVMVNMNDGRETYLKGEEITTFSLNGSTGTVIFPKGPRDSLTFNRISRGPKATGYIYTFNNQEVFESIQMNIDNVSSGKRKSALLTIMKPVANLNITVMGFCDY